MKQKNQTDITEKKLNGEKLTKRENVQYPGLEKRVTTRARMDYLDLDYIDGIYDDEGNQVIRPLTPEEKQWYSDFNEEYYGTNFQHKKELKQLYREYKLFLYRSNDLSEDEIHKAMYLHFQILAESDAKLIFNDIEDRRELYRQNNERNRCLYNKLKTSQLLDPLNEDTNEYDRLFEYEISEMLLRNASKEFDDSEDTST